MATSEEWHAARAGLEAQLTAVLRNSEPLEPQLGSLLRALFPVLAAEAAGSAEGAEEGGEKREAWEKQLVEHGFFRLLDGLMREAISARQPLMQRSEALVLRLLDAALLLCEEGSMIEPGTIFALLEHLCEGSILPDCEAVFGWMEGARGRLASPQLWVRGKLILLRTCNNLLRRLSRALHTVLCGRVLLLLAALFPLSERSALNITGAYNRGNATSWDDPETAAQGLLAGGQEEGELLDVAFYTSFWSLQHFFNYMPSVLPAQAWSRFNKAAQALLSAFEGDPLEEKHNGEALAAAPADDPAVGGAKYLTASQLLRLELRDPSFRRSLLLQLLLLLRFVNGPPAPPAPGLGGGPGVSPKALAEAQAQAASLTQRSAALLRSVPPQGSAFARATDSALERDRNWVLWKAGGCKPFERPAQPEPVAAAPAAAADPDAGLPPGMKRRRVAPRPEHRIKMGHPELDRLWSAHESLGEAAASGERGPPSTMDFVDPVREQLDPAYCEEMDLGPELKKKNDTVFVWKALRLVARSNLASFGRSAEWEGGAADFENVVRELVGVPRPVKEAAKPDAAAAAAAAAGEAADGEGKGKEEEEGGLLSPPGGVKPEAAEDEEPAAAAVEGGAEEEATPMDAEETAALPEVAEPEPIVQEEEAAVEDPDV